jgi:hypothetical protein
MMRRSIESWPRRPSLSARRDRSGREPVGAVPEPRPAETADQDAPEDDQGDRGGLGHGLDAVVDPGVVTRGQVDTPVPVGQRARTGADRVVGEALVSVHR